MKGIISNFLAGLLMVFALIACSKQPLQEINAAKAAVDAAVAEGAEKYAPAETRKVNEELAEAMAEMNAQDARFLKDYKKAKEMLARAKSDAEALKAGLPARKQEVKKQALRAWEEAMSAMEQAKSLLAKASRNSKGIEGLGSLDTDAKGLDEDLREVKNLIDTEDYTTAIEKAGVAKEGATALSEKVGQIPAPAKSPKKKKAKKKKHS
jgi:ABC-type transporter Mla subunit MlaD